MKADRNKLIQLRQAVEETFGQTPGSPTDFDKLSLQIQTFTKRKLGVSTLKRFWGYVRSDYNVTYTTLSVLARYYEITIPQRLLGVKVDAIVGPQNLSVFNRQDTNEIFKKIKQARISYIDRICHRHPTNTKFRNGWLRRLDSL